MSGQQVYVFTAPTGGKDLPSFVGGMLPIPNQGGLGLPGGTTTITVTVTPSDITAPLGNKGWFAIFVNDGLEAIGQLGSNETLTLSNFGVTDTDTVTIKWRCAALVTNTLLEAETARTVICWDEGT